MLPLIIAYILFTAMYLYRESHMRIGKDAQNMKGGEYDKGSSLLGGVFIATCFASPILFTAFKIGIDTILPFMQWIGITLLITGIYINLWSVKTLGKFYARTLLIQKDHKVVRNGLYKWIRHPGYLGANLVGLGLGLASGNVYVFSLILILMVIFYTYRIHYEEIMLTHKFGKEYKEYQQHTWRLVPFIY